MRSGSNESILAHCASVNETHQPTIRRSEGNSLGDLLLAGEVCYSGSAYSLALARFGTHRADRFTKLGGLWDERDKGVGRFGYPSNPRAELHR
ncbi:DUF6000 family protein [Streptomyces sp. NPDC098101]|uniref:DUF6000 family protein n=1 Tax=Streptomyces sp. NPDC098101 TaxID=3366096 RepID=UPI0037F9F22F